MAIGAVLNACWDLAARPAGKPLWRLLADLSPATSSSTWSTSATSSDALTRDEALDLLERGAAGRAERIAVLERDGYPAYATHARAGWATPTIGWPSSAPRRPPTGSARSSSRSAPGSRTTCAAAGSPARAVGDDIAIALDANQVWDVPAAISWIQALRPLRPAWIEEPTSPDDILGLARIRAAVTPVPIATGEHVANRVIFKQLLQAGAIDIMQIDACRVAGVNENLANLLLAAKFGVPVCPHAGGVGLCEIVQHLSMFDYVALSGHHARPHDRVDRPPARALRHPGRGAPRPVRRAAGARRVHRAADGLGGRVLLPVRRRPGARWRRCDQAGPGAAGAASRWVTAGCGSPG